MAAIRYMILSMSMALASAGIAPAVAAPVDLYATRCAMCHQPQATGLAGAFPRLAGRAGAIAQTPEGRHYLILVLLNGLYGRIDVDGSAISGMMPTMRMLKDDEIAGVLNHVASLRPAGRKPAPFTAAEVAKVRAEPAANGSKVAGERARLVAAGKIR